MKLTSVRALLPLVATLLVFTLSCRRQEIAPESGDIHLALGNPSGAVASTAKPDNYLMVRSQYALSYNRARGCANWVAWHLNGSRLGLAQRQNNFKPDNALPAGWYQAKPDDYTGSGFDRGHYCPSGDRTSTVAANSATFLMTNIMPQSPDSNQGPWEELESYCRSLVGAGSELYIVAGSYGTGGRGSEGRKTKLADGKITVPASLYKIIVVLPDGGNDLSRINGDTRVIAVRMPNVQGIRDDAWRQYRVSVNQVEAATGYDFLSNVPSALQSQLEQDVDGQ